MSETSSGSVEGGTKEEAGKGGDIDVAHTHPLLPGAEKDSSRSDDVLWCSACNKPIPTEAIVTIDGHPTCPECTQKLIEIDSEVSLQHTTKVRIQVACY